MTRTARRLTALAAASALALAACGSDDDDTSTEDSTGQETTTDTDGDAGDADADDDTSTDTDTDGETDDTAAGGEWPRTIEHAAGTTEIAEQPTVIVSTSVTLTGTILAAEVPLTASAATSPGPITDENGFFSQWADVATERGVEVLYPNLELDLDAIDALAPDLIIGSSIGQDATIDAYDQLSEIAPTILLDYGSYSWQELAEIIGEATGNEDGVVTAIEGYDAWLAGVDITVDAQPVTVITYNGADGGGVFSAGSAQASVTDGLGLEYAAGPDDIAETVRSDVSFYTAENLPTALANTASLYVAGDQSTVEAVLADPLLANVPAVANEQVVAVGPTAFRIDYFSAQVFVENLRAFYGS